eukprot:803353_1
MDRYGKDEAKADANFVFDILREGNVNLNAESDGAAELDSAAGFRMFLESRFRGKRHDTERFISELEAMLNNDESLFRRLMLPTVPRGGRRHHSSSMHMSLTQDSIIRLLLNAEPFQSTIMKLILEKLPSAGENPDFADPNIRALSPALLLSQLRFLDEIFDSRTLCLKLREVLAVCVPGVQKELIGSLPEIVDQNSHIELLETLQELLNDSDFSVPVIDALSNLQIPEAALSDLRETVLSTTLDTANIDDLPVVIRFLLQTTTKDNVVEVIRSFRKKLNLETLGSGKEGIEGSVLVIDTLRTCIRFQEHLAPTFLKEIGRVGKEEDHHMLDVWLLLVIHALPQYSQKVRALFKRKFAQGAFPRELLELSICDQQEAIESLFQSILLLAGFFVEATDRCTRTFGALFYELLFKAFTNNFHRQDIIAGLVAHIGSGNNSEVSTGLSTLLSLSRWNSSSVKPFITFVKGLLDYLDEMSDSHVRTVFTVYSILSIAEHDSDEIAVGSEFHIFLTKAVSSPMYHRVGLIGVVCLVRELSSGAGGAEMDKKFISTGIQLLDSLARSCEHNESHMALLCDELVRTLSSGKPLHPEYQEWVERVLCSRFEDSFPVDLNKVQQLPDLGEETKLSYRTWHNLDGQDARLAINILQPLCTPDKIRSLELLSPLFRIFATCTLLRTGSMDDADAVVGCPVLCCDQSQVKEFYTLPRRSKDTVCHVLFYTINWFRELLNAFGGGEDPEMNAKLCSRLATLVTLQTQLGECMAENLNFLPICASQDQNRPKRGKKRSTEQLIELNDDNDFKELSAKRKKPTKSRIESSVASVSKYFRELDLSAFKLLRFKLSLGDGDSSPSGMKDGSGEPSRKKARLEAGATEDPSLSPSSDRTISQGDCEKTASACELKPAALLYLVDDLRGKVKILFGKSPPGFGKSKSKNFVPPFLAEYTPLSLLKELAPVFVYLRVHVLSFMNALGRKEGENADAMVVNDEVDNESKKLLMKVFSLIFTILKTLIDSSELDSEEGHMALAVALSNFATDGSEDLSRALPTACQKLFGFVASFSPILDEFAVSVQLVDLLQTLAKSPLFGRNPGDFLAQLSEIAHGMLVKEWPYGSKFKFDTLGKVISIYLRFCDAPIEKLEYMVREVLKSLIPTEEEGSESESEGSEFKATLTYSTVMFYYRTIFETFVKLFTQNAASSVSNFDWYLRMAHLFQDLVFVCRDFSDNQKLLCCCIKQSRFFLDALVKNMNSLGKKFSDNRQAMFGTLKYVQKGTRLLHRVCADVKRTHDSSLAANIPFLKRAMESFIYHVKLVFKANNMLDMFRQGVLKKRGLNGATQCSSSSESEEQEGEKASGDGREEQEQRPGGRSEEQERLVDDQSEEKERLVDDQSEEKERMVDGLSESNERMVDGLSESNERLSAGDHEMDDDKPKGVNEQQEHVMQSPVNEIAENLSQHLSIQNPSSSENPKIDENQSNASNQRMSDSGGSQSVSRKGKKRSRFKMPRKLNKLKRRRVARNSDSEHASNSGSKCVSMS